MPRWPPQNELSITLTALIFWMNWQVIRLPEYLLPLKVPIALQNELLPFLLQADPSLDLVVLGGHVRRVEDDHVHAHPQVHVGPVDVQDIQRDLVLLRELRTQVARVVVDVDRQAQQRRALVEPLDQVRDQDPRPAAQHTTATAVPISRITASFAILSFSSNSASRNKQLSSPGLYTKSNSPFSSIPSNSYTQLSIDYKSMRKPRFLFIVDPIATKQDLKEKLTHYKSGENPKKRNVYGEIYPTRTSLMRQRNPQTSSKTKSKRIQIQYNQSSIFHETIRKEKTALMEFCHQFKGNLMEAIDFICTQNFWGLFNEFLPQLEFFCQTQNLKSLKYHVHFLAQWAFEEKYFDQAAFLFKQILGIAEVSKDRSLKVKALMGVAQCAVRIKCYKQAIEIFKKALQYAWVLENLKLELIIFDQLGLCYFYEGNINRARFYHAKYMNNESEPLRGYFRKMSEKQIQFFEMTIKNTTDTIDQILMLKVSLPVTNYYDAKLGKADEFKTVTIKSCSCSGVVDQVYCSYELQNFKYDYFSERTKKEESFEFRPIPKYILEIKERYKEKKKLNYSMHETILPLDKILYTISRTVRSNSHKLGELQEQIYMRHMLKQDEQNQELRTVKQLNRLKLIIKQI